MQDNVLAVVMAILLVFFLWSVNRRRDDRRFRLWLLGWSLVMVHFLSLLWQPASGFGSLLREGHIASLEILAGVCFILTDPSILHNRIRMLQTASVGIVPALGTVALILFQPHHLGVLYFSILSAHGFAILLVRRFVGSERGKSIALIVLILLSTAWMLAMLLLDRPGLILASIPAEIFLMNAILFAANYAEYGPGAGTAVVGFVLWAAASAATIALRWTGATDAWFPSILHLPQFLVAIGMTMIALDEDTQAARELAEEYETLFHANPNSVWIYDRRTLRFLSVNQVAVAKHGYTMEEMLTKKLTDLIAPEHRPRAEAEVLDQAAGDNLRSVHLRKDGTRFPVRVMAYCVRFRGREARMAIAVDLTEQEQMFGQLIYQLEHDTLTALPNRRKLLPMLTALCDQAQREGTACAVIVLQIDRFEKINEIHGYTVGDGLLKQVVAMLRGVLQPSDALGRTGGSEFTIGLANLADGETASQKAEEIQELFEGMVFVDEFRLEIAVKIGLAVFPEDSDDMSSLWRDAIRALGLARRPGERSPARLSRTLSQREQEENRLEVLMRRALLSGGFEVFYQLILDRERSICAMEALLRLRDAEGGMVNPSRFIPLAESTGIIVPIGHWVLQQACRQIRSWQIAGLPVVPIAVNVSAHQLALSSLFTEVQVALMQFDLEPGLLHLEVTESSVMLDKTLALENMTLLSRLGIRFSIDDFGTGFSSLDRLHQLPVATLKIDRTFVLRMLDENGTRPIVATVISMAHSLGLNVIAEGVETEEQFAALREMGCDQFQGYLFSRPVPAAQATALLG
jgi:diguanylate cyclase (GGDEF)-like protein/PAS domain S-box-containing protein